MVIDLLKVFLCFSELEVLDMRFPFGCTNLLFPRVDSSQPVDNFALSRRLR